MRIPMLCPSSLVAAGLCVLVMVQRPAPTPEPAVEVCGPSQRAVDQRLVGLWQRHEALREGDPLRFYYFHPEGFGIYRYGKVGLTNTHSFDYDASQGLVDLRFRKTDRTHAVRYRFEHRDGREWLVLAGDPRASPIGKPGDRAEAATILRALTGAGSHRVTTAFVLADARGAQVQWIERQVTTRVHMRGLDEAELAAYLDSEDWRDKAGGYGIQSRAAGIVTGIEGSYTAVVGLPLAEVLVALRGLGVR